MSAPRKGGYSGFYGFWGFWGSRLVFLQRVQRASNPLVVGERIGKRRRPLKTEMRNERRGRKTHCLYGWGSFLFLSFRLCVASSVTSIVKRRRSMTSFSISYFSSSYSIKEGAHRPDVEKTNIT